MARASFEAAFLIDVRPILPTLTVPTLVIHAREDNAVPVQGGRYLADHIPGARYLEVEGVDHVPFLTEPDKILAGIEEFLTGSHAAPAQSHRALRTVLFTDIVASTQHAAASGDERWRAVLHRFGEITADLTERFGGTVVKSTGDGHLATFDGPTQAIRCAEAVRADAETLASRSAPASTPASVNCWMPTSGESRYTSRRGSSARPAPVKSSYRAPCVTWWSARAPASRTVAASSCVACPAPGNCWRSTATARGRDQLRRNWRQRPLLVVGRNAPLGSRCRGDSDARAADYARAGPHRFGHRSQLNSGAVILAVDLGKTSCRAAVAGRRAEGAGAPGLATPGGVRAAEAAILSVARELGPVDEVIVGAAGAFAAPDAARALGHALLASLPAQSASRSPATR